MMREFRSVDLNKTAGSGTPVVSHVSVSGILEILADHFNSALRKLRPEAVNAHG